MTLSIKNDKEHKNNIDFSGFWPQKQGFILDNDMEHFSAGVRFVRPFVEWFSHLTTNAFWPIKPELSQPFRLTKVSAFYYNTDCFPDRESGTGCLFELVEFKPITAKKPVFNLLSRQFH